MGSFAETCQKGCDSQQLNHVLTQLNRLGIGISLHPINSGNEEKGMVQVLPEFTLEHPYWLVSHIDAKDTPKIREMLNKLKVIMNKL